MESFISNAIIQGGSVPTCNWGDLCSYWQWTFWAGFVVGIVGAIACFWMKPTENA